MDQADLLRHLLDAVEGQGLEYGITGSHATVAFGEARLTNDIDVLVALTPPALPAFLVAFPFPDYYVSEDAARSAVRGGGMFNIIHPESGLKIDVIVPSTEFDRGQLDRAVSLPAFVGREAKFVSPEDVIIKKMEYHREGGSEKHLRDIAGVLKVMGDRVDRAYISNLSSKLGLDPVWQLFTK